MTQKVRTITIREGQARPRRMVRAVTKYAALTVAGVILFRAGADYAFTQRGYRAIGGEVFALFLPVIYYAISATVRDWLKEIKQEFQKEDSKNEETW